MRGLNLARLLLLLAAFLGLAAPVGAQSDDISAASRSVVRVAVAQLEDGQIVDFGHGSGFAVAPNRVVTNAHVVALAVSDPDNVRIGIIPAEGSPPSPARILAVDPARDLALLELQQGSLPPVALFTGRVPAGAAVAALGYPGNVDMATAQSFEDMLQPRPPSRSMGNFSDMRSSPVGPSMVHTAPIARGHSGGPLVDACGRVVGVNVALTGTDGGDATFGFAIPVASLIAFLREAGQPVRAIAAECVSVEARQREEAERAESERRAREADEAARVREADQRRAQAMAAIEESRETRLYIAILLLVLAVAAMGAGGILMVKNQNRAAIAAGVVAGLMLIGSAVVFLTRPSLNDVALDEQSEGREGADASRFVGENLCRLDPQRSRVTVSDERAVELSWNEQGCVNENTQYARDGAVWRRVLVPNQEQTVTVSEFDPATGQYVVSRYLLSARAMEQARQLRRRIEQKACTPNEEARLRMADRQRDLIQALPERPNERLVYACEPVGG
jgi:S1-C subfamily serine protease